MTSRRKREILTRMSQHHTTLSNLLATLSPEQWQLVVYTSEDSDQWSVRSVIAHLASAAASLLTIAQAVAKGNNPVPTDFDSSRWNKRVVQHSTDYRNSELLQQLSDAYCDWLSYLEAIPDHELDHSGRHPSGAIMPVADMFIHYARHEASHAADILSAINRH